MNQELTEADLDAIERELARETPFGSREHAPHAAVIDFSRAREAAANNLVEKAVGKSLKHEDQKVARLLDRLADMEYDKVEEQWPALVAAQMSLFHILSDQAEMETISLDCDCGRDHDEIGLVVDLVGALVGKANAVRQRCLAREVRTIFEEAANLDIDLEIIAPAVERVHGIEDGVDLFEVSKDTSRADRRALIESYVWLSASAVSFLAE